VQRSLWLAGIGLFFVSAIASVILPISSANSEPLSPNPLQQSEESELVAPPERSSPVPPTVVQRDAISAPLNVFPVGLNAGGRNVFPSILIRGKEDGAQAVDFQNWLIPYDAAIKALKFSTKTLPDGQLELRAPGLMKRIDPSKLRTDPQLGLVFSVQELQDLFQVKAEFDINEYAVRLLAPWLDITEQQETAEAPVILEGLPHIPAPSTTLTAIEQRASINNSQNSASTIQGNLTAVGSLFGGSWFVRLDQTSLFNLQNWNLSEAQFRLQTDSTDYIIGSQPAFWLQQGTGTSDYWGFTTIQRYGFKPPAQFYGGTDLRQRLQSNRIGRTISGQAAPGTLVRLVKGFSGRTIAEVLVDSSGIYRFEDIKTDSQSFGEFYRVLLYPQGQLTALAEIRDATFLDLPEQIPAGSSVFITSGGLRRESMGTEAQSLLGNFTDWRGGIAARWGLSNELTVGLGEIFDRTARVLGEFFFQPSNIPIKVAFSALSGNDENPWEIRTDIKYDPSRTVSVSLTSDRLSSRFNLNWTVFPSLSLFATVDSRDAISGGLQFSSYSKGSSTFARVALDSKNRFRWNLTQYLNDMKFSQQGNEISTLSEFIYNFSKDIFQERGHSLIATYETQNQSNRSDNLATLSYRYRSQEQTSDGNYLWEARLGYGLGSRGAGIIASVGTTIVPGLLLRGRYQQVSAISDQSAFIVELVSSLNVQNGVVPGDRRADYLRTLGGLSIEPFFDRNNNGKRDLNEEAYTDSPELLIILNNQPLRLFQAEVGGDRILVRVPPGTYRLDLDPSGFPPDWQATGEAYAVDVAAGSYTPVPVALIPSYTLAGVVADAQGKPVSGARVEAVQFISGQRIFSVTNDAGVYYIERLQQGTYSLQINGKAASPQTITLDRFSKPLQELNLIRL
jgi:Carboxypeptidase regulatory-like domain